MLTAAAVAKLKPTVLTREVPVGGVPGLYLAIQPSGRKTWALRYRRPSGKTARLVLGTVFETAASQKEPDQEPVVGGHLSLGGARRLAGELRHGVALGRD